MELFDSHAHLNEEIFSEDLEKVIEKCNNNGVKYIVNIGYNEKTSQDAVYLAQKYDNMYATIGIHPEECLKENDLTFLKELFNKSKKVVAIGEIGLDYHYDDVPKELQKDIFIRQIDIANELNLPIVIHSRDADMDMLQVLKNNKINNSFVMHCFSSSVEIAKELLKLNCYISFAGTLTFKNAKNLIEVAKLVPLDRILIETDAPYLAPEPYRGKRNDPSLIAQTLVKLAQIKQINIEDMAEITTQNTKKFYKIL